ncbi:MAG: helical backbone metal receptor [Synergistaceae bacterium]|nr:helical backbone metal receptor [Synergistaceae bacterium]
MKNTKRLKKITVALFTILMTALMCADGSAAGSQKSPERILSLTPAGTEIIFSLGLGDRVIGVTKYCNWPPEARSKPVIGDMMNLSLEAITIMSPDLVLLSNMNEHLDPKVKSMGFETVIVYQDDFKQICDSIRDVGQVCGIPDTAEKEINELQESVRVLSESARSADNGFVPRVLVVVGRDPSEDNLKKIYAAGLKSFYDELVRESGGVNVLAQDVPYAQLSQEGLISLNPDVIIDLIGAHGGKDKPIDEIIGQWRPIPYIKAIEEGRVAVIKGDFTLRAGPRYPLILEAFIRVIRDGETKIEEQ